MVGKAIMFRILIRRIGRKFSRGQVSRERLADYTGSGNLAGATRTIWLLGTVNLHL